MAGWIKVRQLPDLTLVNGPNAGRLLREARANVDWSRRRKAYITNHAAASRPLATADHAGVRVIYIDDTTPSLLDLGGGV